MRKRRSDRPRNDDEAHHEPLFGKFPSERGHDLGRFTDIERGLLARNSGSAWIPNPPVLGNTETEVSGWQWIRLTIRPGGFSRKSVCFYQDLSNTRGVPCPRVRGEVSHSSSCWW